ncbi:protein of unknown function [Altererythrobacter xiamenensis]|uniref:DUF4331 domain-containing protein n=1 Tax=Altererythrobacter xiamenensis TaxID=1316679 RepID=A0A1Y6F5S6_9SPHN|nr:DUF4331 family protein [Altererythrobacter xiamenensis]SMQ69806.1 protein of unknown function [Altererythrobacter xiamenensis]
MRKTKHIAGVAAGLVLAGGAAAFLPGIGLIAADHLDPPERTDPSQDDTPDRAADIADLYAWHTGDRVNMILTFAGPQATSEPATYDRDVLYTINVSNAGSRTDAEIPIRIRFGSGMGSNDYGVQVSGVPGTAGPIQGSVETTLMSDGVMARAGLFDDPFFFDLQGFKDTASSGTLMFDADRDFFAGQNLTAVVLSIPRDRIENGENPIDVWATTARFGGQL